MTIAQRENNTFACIAHVASIIFIDGTVPQLRIMNTYQLTIADDIHLK